LKIFKKKKKNVGLGHGWQPIGGEEWNLKKQKATGVMCQQFVESGNLVVLPPTTSFFCPHYYILFI